MNKEQEKAEKIRQYKKEYYRKHKEERKEIRRQYTLEHKEDRRKYCQEHKEEIKKSHQKYCSEHREEIREQRREYLLIRKYNVDITWYNQKYIIQEGKCEICGTHQNDLKKYLFVDHNHTTNKVRSLLCPYCNSLLSYAKESVEILRKTKSYLIEHEIKKNDKKWVFVNQYRVIRDMYNQQFINQDGKCAICDIPHYKLKRRLAVDHNHDTKQIRKLLCYDCNTMLGCSKESIEIIDEAIKYLEKYI